VCERRVDLLVCSLPLHRHSYIGFILTFASSFHNKQQKGAVVSFHNKQQEVLDLRIPHDSVGSSTDPTLNGHLKYPNNLDQSLNDTTTDKIRKYPPDYNNHPPSPVSFIPPITSTSGLRWDLIC
jgi:hypothetical protein